MIPLENAISFDGGSRSVLKLWPWIGLHVAVCIRKLPNTTPPAPIARINHLDEACCPDSQLGCTNSALLFERRPLQRPVRGSMGLSTTMTIHDNVTAGYTQRPS